jgi:hypothetical protein
LNLLLQRQALCQLSYGAESTELYGAHTASAIPVGLGKAAQCSPAVGVPAQSATEGIEKATRAMVSSQISAICPPDSVPLMKEIVN